MIISSAKRLDSVSTYYFAKKLKQIAAMNVDGQAHIINLGIGSPDLAAPTPVIETLQKSASEPMASKYQSYTGIVPFRTAFAKWYQRHFNVSLDPSSEVLPLIGSKEGIMHISMAFLNPGDEVLVPNPGYPAYSAVTKLAGGVVKNYDLSVENSWQPDFDALAQMDLSKVKIMWLNYPHMPTGAKADKDLFERLIKFAKRHEILLCHDNPYAFILNEDTNSLLSVEGAKDVSLELTSLSKCYNMAGWRVGAVVGHSDYLKAILTFKSNMDSGMYLPIQKAAITALESPDSWFDKINSIYRERRILAFEIMDLLGCSYDRSSVGMFVWGRLNTTISSDEFSENILQKSRVFITPGHIFGSQGEGFIRISLCSTQEQLSQALDKIKAII